MKYFLILLFITQICFSQENNDLILFNNLDSLLVANGLSNKEQIIAKNYKSYFDENGAIRRGMFSYTNNTSTIVLTKYTFENEMKVNDIYKKLKTLNKDDLTYKFNKAYNFFIFHKNEIYLLGANCYLKVNVWRSIIKQLFLKKTFSKQMYNYSCGALYDWEPR